MSDWPVVVQLANLFGRIAPAIYRSLRPLSAPEKVQRRVRWRREFGEQLKAMRPGYYGKVVLRDIKRLDVYPDLGHPQRISAWYRSEMVGYYHRGIEIILSASGRYAVPDATSTGSERWRWLGPAEDSSSKVTAVTVGRIPFEWIEAIDWDGDEFYSEPHLYCHFIGPWWGPCEAVVYKAPLSPTSQDLHDLEGLAELKPGAWQRVKLWYPERSP